MGGLSKSISSIADITVTLSVQYEITASCYSQFTLKNSFGDFDTAAAHRRVASNAASHAVVTAQMEMQFLM